MFFSLFKKDRSYEKFKSKKKNINLGISDFARIKLRFMFLPLSIIHHNR